MRLGARRFAWIVAMLLPVVLGPVGEACAQGRPSLEVAQAAPATGPGSSAPAGAATTGGGAPFTPVPVAPPPTVPSVAPPTFQFLETPSAPGTAFLELRYSLSLSEEYTDNFNHTDTNKRSNFRTEFGPAVRLLINGARLRGELGLNIRGAYDTADDSPEVFAGLVARVIWEPTPLLTLTATDSFNRSDALGLADALNVRRERDTFTSNVFSLGAQYRLPRLSLTGSYALSTFFNTGSSGTSSNGTGSSGTSSNGTGSSGTSSSSGGGDTITNTVTVGTTVPFLQLYSGTLGYEFLQSDTTGGGTDITGNRVNVSVARQIGALASAGLSGSFAYRTQTLGQDYALGNVAVFGSYAVPGIWSVTTSVGYSLLNPNGSGSDFDTPTTSTTVTYQLARLTLSLAADVGFSETFASGENSGVLLTRGVRFTASYPVTPFVTATIGGGYRENQDTAVVTGDGTRTPGTTEDTWTGTASVSVSLLRWLTLVLDYTYTKANSSVPQDEYTENRVRATLSASF